ncbi:MAG: hypothetical protein ABSG68_01345 [Thermoguttaceae bacterium]|jgi:hypothetical protein
MAESSSGLSPTATGPTHRKQEPPESVLLVEYPKIVFLYPVFLVSIAAAVFMSFHRPPLHPLDDTNIAAAVVATLFLATLAVNLVILAFDFPRTTSLTLFFFLAAVVLAFVLLCTLRPNVLPWLTGVVQRFRPLASATFYWAFAAIMAALYVAMFVVVRFDYWEVRPNELLHHHGFLSNLERLSAPNLRIDKQINDVFEYMLLRSGRLILEATTERRVIVLDNVPFIERKEKAITSMLGALQVEVRGSSSNQ